jgi:hypothetical protein
MKVKNHRLLFLVLATALSSSAFSAPRSVKPSRYFDCELSQNYSVEINLASQKAAFYDNYGDPADLLLTRKTIARDVRGNPDEAFFFEGMDVNGGEIPLRLFFNLTKKYIRLDHVQGESQLELIGHGKCTAKRRPSEYLK